MDSNFETRIGMSIQSGKEDSDIDDIESEARGDKMFANKSVSQSQLSHLRSENSGYFTRSKGRVPATNNMPSTSIGDLEAHLMENQHKMVDEIKYGFQQLSQQLASSIQEAIAQSNDGIARQSQQLSSHTSNFADQRGSTQSSDATILKSQQLDSRRSNFAGPFRSRAVSPENSSSDDTDDQSAQAGEIGESIQSRSRSVNFDNQRSYGSARGCKLPAFTGRESWKTWFGRFQEVARRKRWSNDEKLDELLPRLQGVAGEFVFNQLLPRTRANYAKLTQELNSRFQIIELPKTFRSKLAKRAQKYGESVEDFAADLKMLYDKAFPERSHRVRQEDLLRYFLDGLIDDQARQQVEFVKEPSTIDEAIVEVVTFQESRRRTDGERGVPDKGKRSRSINMVRPSADDEDEESESEESTESRIARMNTRPGKKHGNADAMSRCPSPETCLCGFDELKCGPCKKCHRRHVEMNGNMVMILNEKREVGVCPKLQPVFIGPVVAACGL